MDGQSNGPEPICPFNFFEVGGITVQVMALKKAQFMTILSFDLQV